MHKMPRRIGRFWVARSAARRRSNPPKRPPKKLITRLALGDPTELNVLALIRNSAYGFDSDADSERVGIASEVGVTRRTEERDYVPNVFHSRNVHQQPFKSKAESRVRGRAKTPQVQVPPIGLQG